MCAFTLLVLRCVNTFLLEARQGCRDNLTVFASWGCVSRLIQERTIWIGNAHHGQRFIVRADEELTAFLELVSVIQAYRE
jgi:hypothetical protein